MRIHWLELRRVASFLLLPALTACGSDSGGSSGSGGGATRSSTCLAWQSAECDVIAGRCQTSTRAECDDTLQSFFCKSDETMQACIKALPSSECGVTPATCYGIVDSAPAVTLCNQVVSAYCNAKLNCKLTSDIQACVASAGSALNCASAVGASPSIDSCFAVLGAPDCTTIGTTLPSQCKGVIKLNTTMRVIGDAPPQVIREAMKLVSWGID